VDDDGNHIVGTSHGARREMRQFLSERKQFRAVRQARWPTTASTRHHGEVPCRSMPPLSISPATSQRFRRRMAILTAGSANREELLWIVRCTSDRRAEIPPDSARAMRCHSCKEGWSRPLSHCFTRVEETSRSSARSFRDSLIIEDRAAQVRVASPTTCAGGHPTCKIEQKRERGAKAD